MSRVISPSEFGMVNPAIFENLQAKIDEDTQLREELRNVLQDLEKQGRVTQSILSRAHSTPLSGSRSPQFFLNEHVLRFHQVQLTVSDAENSIAQQTDIIAKLSKVASRYPYYKYSNIWTRDVQTTCFTVLLCGWLSGFSSPENYGQSGRLLTIEEVGHVLGVPVNLKERDAFHLSIEEYLHSLISLIDELTRLAVNAVTLGDYERPLQISQFVKDIHAGFQILNLKNDSLRRRSDSIKYSMKKIEDIVYDLSLRDLLPRQSRNKVQAL